MDDLLFKCGLELMTSVCQELKGLGFGPSFLFQFVDIVFDGLVLEVV